MSYLESISKVLLVGLILGAGLPALFAVGLVTFSRGAGDPDADGTVRAAHPVLKVVGVALFTVVAAVIVVALLWITRSTIAHHFGVDLFPFVK